MCDSDVDSSNQDKLANVSESDAADAKVEVTWILENIYFTVYYLGEKNGY